MIEPQLVTHEERNLHKAQEPLNFGGWKNYKIHVCSTPTTQLWQTTYKRETLIIIFMENIIQQHQSNHNECLHKCTHEQRGFVKVCCLGCGRDGGEVFIMNYGNSII